jgi:hypothetical protein
LKEISSFKHRFPESFKAPFEYKSGIEELKIFSDKIYVDVDKLPTQTYQNQDKTYTYVSSNSIKDLIDEKDKDKKDKEKEN